jgi:hypothetical protein
MMNAIESIIHSFAWVKNAHLVQIKILKLRNCGESLDYQKIIQLTYWI